MPKKILFLHNKAISYRIPLFDELIKKYGENIEFWFFSDTEKNFSEKPFVFFGSRYFFACSRSLLSKKDFSIAILSGSHSIELIILFFILKWQKKKIVFWTETWEWKPMSLKNTLYIKAISFIAKHVDIVLYPGQKVQKLYCHIGIPEEKQVFLPNSSVLIPFEKEKKSEPIFQKTKKYRILFAGRGLKRKGLEYLLQAFSLCNTNEYELLVATNDHSLKKKYPMKNITWLPTLDSFDFRAVLLSSDIYVYPSINHKGMAEPWGLSINEAIFENIPVITTDSVGCAYDLIKEGKNGFIVPQKDPQKLYDAIVRSKNLDRKELKKTNIKIKEIYSYKNMAESFQRAIEIVSR